MTYAIPASHKGFAGIPAGRYTGEDLSYRGKPEFSDRVYREVAEGFGVTRDDLNAGRPLTLSACKNRAFYSWVSKRDARPTEPRSPRQILQWWSDYLRT